MCVSATGACTTALFARPSWTDHAQVLCTHLYSKFYRLVFLIQRVYGQLRSVLGQFLTLLPLKMQIRAGNPCKNDKIQILEGQYPQQCCNASLGMLTGSGANRLVAARSVCTGSPQFVLDGGCAPGPTAVIRGDKCPPADTGEEQGRLSSVICKSPPEIPSYLHMRQLRELSPGHSWYFSWLWSVLATDVWGCAPWAHRN